MPICHSMHRIPHRLPLGAQALMQGHHKPLVVYMEIRATQAMIGLAFCHRDAHSTLTYNCMWSRLTDDGCTGKFNMESTGTSRLIRRRAIVNHRCSLRCDSEVQDPPGRPHVP